MAKFTLCLQGEEDWGSGEFVQYFRGEILLSPKVTSFSQGGSAHWLSFQLSGLFHVFSALEPLFTEIKCHQMFRKITTVKILYLQEGMQKEKEIFTCQNAPMAGKWSWSGIKQQLQRCLSLDESLQTCSHVSSSRRPWGAQSRCTQPA